MPRGIYERKPYMGNCGKLTGQHEYIRTLREQGMGQREIANAFGVSKSTIQAIERRDWNPGRGRRAA